MQKIYSINAQVFSRFAPVDLLIEVALHEFCNRINAHCLNGYEKVLYLILFDFLFVFLDDRLDGLLLLALLVVSKSVGVCVTKHFQRRGVLHELGLARATGQVWDTSVMSVRLLGRMLVGQASLRNLSGPLTIADVAGQAARKGLTYYLGLLALVSVSLGVLNLLPLPMLDGGLLMYYLFEGVTGRPVSDLWLKWLQRGGALVLLMMMSIALSNDVARHLGLQ